MSYSFRSRCQTDTEFSQATIRLVLGSIVITYLFALEYSVLQFNHYTYIAVGSALCLMFSAFILLWTYLKPGKIVSRRILGQLVDSTFTTAILYNAEKWGVVAYCIYLWIMVGNAFRFGIPYLISTWIFCIIGFSFVGFSTPFWRDNFEFWVGYFLALLVVPPYLLQLLRKLNETTEKFEHLSRHDALTGVLNRRSLDLSLASLFEKLKRRNDNGVGLILLDIDHFKKINDNHGHIAGDEVLQEFAQRVKKSLRNTDSIARYGGEEFMVIAHSDSCEGIVNAAERIRKVICSAPINTSEGEIQITLSAGVAPWIAKAVDLKSWIDSADRALYKAKNDGRNKVVCAK